MNNFSLLESEAAVSQETETGFEVKAEETPDISPTVMEEQKKTEGDADRINRKLRNSDHVYYRAGRTQK